MTDKQRKGKQGEMLAARYLASKGYSILETNWRYSRSEIDIIAKQGDTLVFVEVKTRSSNHVMDPEDSISPAKVKRIADAATRYMDFTAHEWAIRFDVIGILLKANGQYEIHHHQDSFFPQG